MLKKVGRHDNHKLFNNVELMDSCRLSRAKKPRNQKTLRYSCGIK